MHAENYKFNFDNISSMKGTFRLQSRSSRTVFNRCATLANTIYHNFVPSYLQWTSAISYHVLVFVTSFRCNDYVSPNKCPRIPSSGNFASGPWKGNHRVEELIHANYPGPLILISYLAKLTSGYRTVSKLFTIKVVIVNIIIGCKSLTNLRLHLYI